jgi:hypothetical protein
MVSINHRNGEIKDHHRDFTHTKADLDPDFLDELQEYAGEAAAQLSAAEESFRQRYNLDELPPNWWELPESEPADAPAAVLLVQYRQLLLEQRYYIPPGFWLDLSPTGAGKTFADYLAILRLVADKGKGKGKGKDKRSLLVVPAHINCQQVVTEGARLGLTIVPYPDLNENTCARWREAEVAQDQGLSVPRALCLTCPFQKGCPCWQGSEQARTAQHTVATHARLKIEGDALTNGRDYVSIHDSQLDLFRPDIKVMTGFLPVAQLGYQAALMTDWTRPDDKAYYERLEETANFLHGWSQSCIETEAIPLPQPNPHIPTNVDRHLLDMMSIYGIHPVANALRLTRGLVEGRIDTLWAKVDTRWDGDREQPPQPQPPRPPRVELVRTLIGFQRPFRATATPVLICDATGQRDLYERVTSGPVRDITPRARLARVQDVWQIPIDLTRQKSIHKVADLLRGILHDLPYHRVGVLTYEKWVAKLPGLLGDAYARRITMWSHFYGGHSRGSNEWLEHCDVLIILGTPRLPPYAIREHLLRIGDYRAARLSSIPRGPYSGYGLTPSGRRVTVTRNQYRDPSWHEAAHYTTTAEMLQAIGRSRPYCDRAAGGIPCYVVSTELFAPLEDWPANSERIAQLVEEPTAPLTMKQVRVLEALDQTSKTAEIARALKVTEQRVRELLGELQRAGRVERLGEGKGTEWRRVVPLYGHPISATKC